MKLLKIGASWCTACNQLTKTLSSMDLKIPMEEIDIDVNPEYQQRYAIRGIPVLIKVDDSGKEIVRISGNVTKERVEQFM